MTLLYILPICNFCCAQTITLKNKSDFDRKKEIISIPWTKLSDKNKYLNKDSLIVQNDAGEEIASQIIYRNGEAQYLIFQIDYLSAGETKTFTVIKGKPAKYEAKVYGRSVPERKDDFAWENNLVAHRIYGPALEKTGEISNGIDVWAKRTENLIIDKWYKINNYHVDSGEGMDYYKVGRTLGAGAMAPLNKENKIVLARNYVSYKILDKGPLRFTFEVSYAPFVCNGQLLEETRTFSIDADSYFTNITENYKLSDIDATGSENNGKQGNKKNKKNKKDLSESKSGIKVAAGIILRKQKGEMWQDDKNSSISYWEPAMAKNGSIGVSVIIPNKKCDVKTIDDHFAISSNIKYSEDLNYYMGSAWSKAKVKNAQQWFEITRQQIRNLKNPIKISIK